VEPQIEYRPDQGWRARVLAAVLRHTVRRVFRVRWLTVLLLRFAFLLDRVALLPPPPHGTRRQRVHFGDYPGELLLGPGVSERTDRAVLYFHGGGFVSCGLRTHRRLLAKLSAASDAKVLHVAYRQLPKVKLRQTIDDCLAGYQLLLRRGYPPEKIVFGGDSAGGYLVFAVALRALELGLPAPAGIIALSPLTDMECTHHRTHPNFRTDPYIVADGLPQLLALLADEDPVAPLLSADVSGLPPTLVQVGSLEVLLSDAELISARLAEAGVPTRLQIWQNQIHVFQAFSDLVPKEAHAAIAELGEFVRERTTSAGQDSGIQPRAAASEISRSA
jgi:acetyl esterase/lipase